MSATEKVIVESGFGSVELIFEEDVLKSCHLTRKKQKTFLGSFASHPAVLALLKYLDGDLLAVSGMDFEQEGTIFRHRVWNQMCKIPPGQTLTYGQVALILGSSPRAVGQACGDNKFPIFIPCHRVVGKNGLGGFAHGTDDLPIKQWLLNHEKNFKNE